ncbi:thioredoxin domain-containing protein [Primorskyibacter aestuariivivens]|uniref:thioredoxin family protein n=1 Tax=Primorskyibacter aestuariivivens TaxID=1888912 RepID=UPI0023011920|nr:thioredoxin [Primorskyibacter aestuariivivens]MDA7429397.1 thioredoxin domain-containing protein [Primorskyibacter aestuariivivens]
MKRRDFLVLSAVAAAAGLPMQAHAAPLDYKPGMLKDRLNAGETVFLDFKADWCGTCQAQERVIKALKEENPAYEANITFINVNWDVYGSSQMASRMKIPRRSTLVVLKGDDELGRLVADTREDKIRALMDVALNASTA